jgi:hypothetical protein
MSSDSLLQNLNDCGCCEGITVHTPVEIDNRPGLTAIVYRVGTHVKFKQSMLARLSAYPELAGLKTRDDDDFSIALLDAWATVADVLTFYQERIANESYLRTATERRSVLEMARLIGYELRPGVAASTYLAFTLEDAQGAPSKTVIDIGTKVQSVPGPGEKPQTFETIEKIEARAEWNELRPRMTEFKLPVFGTQVVYLKGVDKNLKPGDALLFIGEEREKDLGNENWDFRRVKTVITDPKKDYTVISLDRPLGSTCPCTVITDLKKDYTDITLDRPLGSAPPYKVPVKYPNVYALRQRANLFGYNAPDWRTMPKNVKKAYASSDYQTRGEWPRFNIAYKEPLSGQINTVYLDRLYEQITLGGWLVLSVPEYQKVYGVVTVTEESRADFALTSKTTRVQLSGEILMENFMERLRDIVVYAQSELLEIAETPITDSVSGESLTLDRKVEGLQKGQTVILSGTPRPHQIPESFPPHQDELPQREFPGLVETLGVAGHANPLKIGLKQASSSISPSDSGPQNPGHVSEVVTLHDIQPDGNLTKLVFTSRLKNYERESVTINANVAKATHGATAQEVLGSGDASQPFQKFTLKQPPLTHISASTPSGAKSTLQVRVNDILWQEMISLYGRGSRDRVYITKTDDDGKTTVQFGDGITGTRLPTGQNNIQVTYRKGIGIEGNVKAEQLTMLLTRPLGVKGVTNPLAATGGDDRESLADARRNAPLTVLTLERAVSLKDYEDFARAFAGISKALATWVWDGKRYSVFMTVAGPKGVAIEEKSQTYENLLTALQKSGDLFVKISIKSYEKAFFKIAGNIKVSPDYQTEKVSESVKQEIRARFSFDARDFGQPVMLSEVIAIMQAVQGVEMVDVDKLYRVGESGLNDRLTADLPKKGENGEMIAAELLMLDPAPIELGVVP